MLNLFVAQMEDDSQSEPAGFAAIARLLVDMVGANLNGLLSLLPCLSVLRRENVCATLRREFVTELPTLLNDLPNTSEALFGKGFSKSVKKLAKKVKDKKTLDSELKPLSAFRGGKQSKKAAPKHTSSGFASSNRGGGIAEEVVVVLVQIELTQFPTQSPTQLALGETSARSAEVESES